MFKFIFTAFMLSLASFSFAGTSTVSPKATATLATSCTFSVQDMSFGLFTPALTGYVDVSTNIISICTKGTAYRVLMDDADARCNTRKLASNSGNGSILNYGLYVDAARTKNLGYTQSCVLSDYYFLTGTGATQSTPVYGRMPSNQFVAPDTYSATNTMILYF